MRKKKGVTNGIRGSRKEVRSVGRKVEERVAIRDTGKSKGGKER